MNIGTDAQVQRYSVISRACLFFRNCGNSYGHSKQYAVNLKVYIRISISWIERHLGLLIGIHGIPNQFDEIGIYVADGISRNHDSNSKNPLGALVAWGEVELANVIGKRQPHQGVIYIVLAEAILDSIVVLGQATVFS